MVRELFPEIYSFGVPTSGSYNFFVPQFLSSEKDNYGEKTCSFQRFITSPASIEHFLSNLQQLGDTFFAYPT